MRRAIFVVLAVVALVSDGAAQATRRTLGAHTFIPSTVVKDPFVTTFVSTVTGGGRANGFQVPVYDREAQEIVGESAGNIGYLTVGVEYQQRIVKWLALRVAGNGAARVGTTVPTLLAEGANANYGLNFGLTGRIVATQRFYLSGVVDYRTSSTIQLSPLEFAQSIIDGGGVDSTAPLVDTKDKWRSAFGLRGAFAIASWLGLNANAEYGPGSSASKETGTSQDNSQFTGGVGASIDIGTVSKVPLGFTLDYQYQSRVSSESEGTGGGTVFSGGVYVTGQKQFVVGLEAVTARVDQSETKDKINALLARIVVRYDF